MANVVRFTLPTARTLALPGVGLFRAGVLDVDANDLNAVSRARYLSKPYGAVEVGTVDEATPAPTLPAVPGPANPDPYPQYVTDQDLANPASTPMAALKAAFVPAIVLTGSGIDPTGVADSTAALQAKINANPSATLLLPSGVYKISSLVLNKGQRLIGSGWHTPTRESFGNSAWGVAGQFFGTVLRSTATSGVAIAMTDPSLAKQGGLADFILLGPGSGTAVGIQLGTSTIPVIHPVIRNVEVANFPVGWRTANVNEGAFYDLAAHGCTLGVDLTVSSNNLAFHMLDVQSCGDGVHMDTTTFAAAFYSPICQNNAGTGFVINGKHNALFNPYFEANSTAGVSVANAQSTHIAAPLCVNATDGIAITSAASDTMVLGVGDQGGDALFTNAGARSYIQGNLARLTDTGTNSVLIDPQIAGTPYGAWASFTPTLAGTGWSLGNGTATGKLTTIGKTVHFRTRITFGSTSTYGTVSPTVSLPVAALGVYMLATGLVNKVGDTGYELSPYPSGSGVLGLYVKGTNGKQQFFTGTAPVTLAAGDFIEIAGTYERS